MKRSRTSVYLLVAVLLISCGRSQPPQLYVLKPVSCKSKQVRVVSSDLKIGIDKIKSPRYAQKKQLGVFVSPRSLKLEPNHEWEENLNQNIMRVIQANLSRMLPKSVVESSPWNGRFSPDYTVQIIISEFQTNAAGYSRLSAEYLIYHKKT